MEKNVISFLLCIPNRNSAQIEISILHSTQTWISLIVAMKAEQVCRVSSSSLSDLQMEQRWCTQSLFSLVASLNLHQSIISTEKCCWYMRKLPARRFRLVSRGGSHFIRPDSPCSWESLLFILEASVSSANQIKRTRPLRPSIHYLDSGVLGW